MFGWIDRYGNWYWLFYVFSFLMKRSFRFFWKLDWYILSVLKICVEDEYGSCRRIVFVVNSFEVGGLYEVIKIVL